MGKRWEVGRHACGSGLGGRCQKQKTERGDKVGPLRGELSNRTYLLNCKKKKGTDLLGQKKRGQLKKRTLNRDGKTMGDGKISRDKSLLG